MQVRRRALTERTTRAAVDLHHQERAARRGRREGFGDRHHAARIVGVACGQSAFRGGQKAVGHAHEATLGQRVARIHFLRGAEQVHGAASGR